MISSPYRTSLIVAIVALLAANWSILISYRAKVQALKPKGVEYSYIGDDYPVWFDVPRIDDPVEMTFAESSSYPMTGERAQALYISMRASYSHDGYVHLGPDHRWFAVSMFHQMHCINQIRNNIVDPDGHSGRHAAKGHIQHCLNYLRQFFLCHADDTLEPGNFLEHEHIMGTVSHTRQCRDWMKLEDATETNWQEWLAYNATHPYPPES